MNPFQKLLQSIGASGITRASGVVNNLGTPIRKSLEDIPANLSILKDLITRGRPTSVVDSQRPIQKSAGVLSNDLLERFRPTNKFQQKLIRDTSSPGDFLIGTYPKREVFISPRRTFSPPVDLQYLKIDPSEFYSGLNPTQRFLQEYVPIQRSVRSSAADSYVPIQSGGLFNRLNSMVTGKPFLSDLPEYGSKLSSGVANTAASLKPTSVPTAFPFDDPLALLQGQARYVQRQVQGGIGQGIGQVGNLYKKLQGVGPAAINPLATKTPTTLLGKAGQFINPLNPINAAGYATFGLINQFVPEDGPLKGNLELLASIPGGPVAKLLGTGLFATTPLGMSDKQETALSQIGKNYIVNGIQYDNKTGRAINPPSNTFVSARQNRLTAPPVDSGFMLAGDPNTGAGTPDQRRVIEERNYQTQLSNAKQQYATPDPMSPDFQGYPNELAAQYGLEQAYGQELKQAGTLVPQLQEAGVGAGMTPENFAAWAKANPGLAVRLLSQGQRN